MRLSTHFQAIGCRPLAMVVTRPSFLVQGALHKNRLAVFYRLAHGLEFDLFGVLG